MADPGSLWQSDLAATIAEARVPVQKIITRDLVTILQTIAQMAAEVF